MKNRSCTDIICCLIFFVYILGYFVVSLFAWLNGNPLILIHPTDSQGRICGLQYNDLDLSNKSTLFYFDITRCAQAAVSMKFQCPTTQICVSECPNEYWTFAIEEAKAAALAPGSNRTEKADAIDWSKFICTYGYDARQEYINGTEINKMMTLQKCAPYIIPYDDIVSRCIPLVSETAGALNASGQAIQSAEGKNITSNDLVEGIKPIQAYLNARSIGEKIFADLTVTWGWLLILLGIGALLSFLWIVIMRWIAGPMVWISILTFIALASFGVFYTYNEWKNLDGQEGSDSSLISVGFTSDLSTYLALKQTWMAFLIILSVIDFILIITVIFLRKRIQIATKVIDMASKAVGKMMSSLFFPLVTFLLCIVVVGFWAMTALFLASTGDPVYQYLDERNDSASGGDNLTGEKCDISNSTNQTEGLTCEFIEYGGDSVFHQNVIWLQVGVLFGMLWQMNWVLALGQCTLAGAFASYYWAWDKKRDVPFFPVFQGFGRSLRYHTGSMAFGAFLIALLQMIRIMLEYVDSKVKKSENKLAKLVLKCCKCCFWCLEKFLKYINRNAYVMIAIYGKGFCWSAKEAFMLLLRNIVRAAVLDKVVGFVLLIGKLVVTAAMGVLTWALFTNKLEAIFQLNTPNLNYYWMPIIIVIITTFIVATGFFNVFGMAADTIFLCFLEDLERNDGSAEKPYYMSSGLMSILGKKNKSSEDSSKKSK